MYYFFSTSATFSFSHLTQVLKTTPEWVWVTGLDLEPGWLNSLYPFLKLEVDCLKMTHPRESQQLAITLTVCLHQSTYVCWPSNMVSRLISCIPLMGSRGASYPHSRHFLSCCILGYVRFLLGDWFFKVLLLLLMVFLFLPLFNLAFIPVCRFPPSWCYLLSFVTVLHVGSSSTVFVSLLCEYLWWFPLICQGIHWTGCCKPFDQPSDFMNRYWRCALRSPH